MKWSEVSQEDKGYPTTEVLATYTLQLIGPREGIGWTRRLLGGPPAYNAQGRGIPPHLLRETEENLTDLLPAGYRVEIKEWDE